MSNSGSRAEVMKPLLIKAGIPAALSVAAYICARIISTQSSSSLESPSTRPEQNSESFHSLDSKSSDDDPESEDEGTTDKQIGNLQPKSLLELETQLEDLRRKEWDLEGRFLRYRAMKERESMLIEIKNKMLSEKNRAEFLLQEVSLMQEQNVKVGGLVLAYVKLVQQLECLKAKNRLLQKKARKVCRRAKSRLKIIGKQRLLIEARDMEVLSNRKEAETRANIVEELEDEVRGLKEAVDHLQREKIELTNKLDFAEKFYSSNTKADIAEGVTKEEYDKVLKEVEQLQKDRAVETNELTYLRWSNACLRHELVRYHEQQEHNKGEFGNRIPEFEFEEEGHDQSGNCYEHDSNETLSCHDDPCLATTSTSNVHATSKRRKFIQKFKKWVEGGQTEDKEKIEIKCFGRNSVSEEAEDQFVHSRKSCSSV